jgi:hypothetical protein
MAESVWGSLVDFVPGIDALATTLKVVHGDFHVELGSTVSPVDVKVCHYIPHSSILT